MYLEHAYVYLEHTPVFLKHAYNTLSFLVHIAYETAGAPANPFILAEKHKKEKVRTMSLLLTFAAKPVIEYGYPH